MVLNVQTCSGSGPCHGRGLGCRKRTVEDAMESEETGCIAPLKSKERLQRMKLELPR